MVLQGNAISKFIRTTYGSFSSEDLMDDLVGLFTSTAPGTALLDRLNAASISKNDTRNSQRKPFVRFTHLARLSASFWSLKCQKKGDVSCYVAFLRY